MNDPIINEKWKTIKEFPDYAVSDQGRIKRLTDGPLTCCGYKSTYSGTILKPGKNLHGYLQVTLCKNKQKNRITVHKLVLEAFVSPRPPSYECNHKKGIKTDNRLKEIEWMTCSENHVHAVKVLGQIGNKSHNHKLTEKEVIQIRQMYKTGDYTYRNLGKLFNVTHVNIGYIIQNKFWTHI